MNLFQNPYLLLKDITTDERTFLKQITSDLTETQQRYFFMIYSNKRKSAQDILLFTLVGFIGLAGIQRIVTGQIGLGILYIFTAGLCWIGTIVDLVNHKSLANEFNQKMAWESYKIACMGG
jgi:TM2 domain-containing membrane protein YozV